MASTTGRALVLTVVAAWLVGCATAPASRADKEALLMGYGTPGILGKRKRISSTC